MVKDLKTLDLVLMHKYYDQIERDEKPEEYRDTLFWCSRLLDVDREGYGYFQKSCRGDFEDIGNKCKDSLREFTRLLKVGIEEGMYAFHDYEFVRLHRGYTSTCMVRRVTGISIGFGIPELGAPKDKEVFIIKLGARLS